MRCEDALHLPLLLCLLLYPIAVSAALPACHSLLSCQLTCCIRAKRPHMSLLFFPCLLPSSHF